MLTGLHGYISRLRRRQSIPMPRSYGRKTDGGNCLTSICSATRLIGTQTLQLFTSHLSLLGKQNFPKESIRVTWLLLCRVIHLGCAYFSQSGSIPATRHSGQTPCRS